MAAATKMNREVMSALRRIVEIGAGEESAASAPEDAAALHMVRGWIEGRKSAADLPVGEEGQTYREAAAQRDVLFLLVANLLSGLAWKSLRHPSGEEVKAGWFLAGMGERENAVVFLLPLSLYGELECRTLGRAFKDEEATAADILALVQEGCLPY